MPHPFAAYVPALVLRHYRRDPEPPTQAEGDQFPAVALFADVAGSTKIANQLSQFSRLVGPEEMYRILNNYYQPLVSLLQARGGDVIGFAGDAVIAIWPANTDAGLKEAVRQATQAALEVQRDLNNLELAPGIRLSLRITIGAGALSTALVGGRQGFWKIVAYGPPFDQIRAAGHITRTGGVFLSHEACAALGNGVVKEPQPGGAFVTRFAVPPPLPVRTDLAEVAALPEPYLRPFVQRVVQEGIDSGTGDYMDQSRTVSMLFVRIGRPSETQPSWERIQNAMALVQEAAARYEGTVSQFIEDDKGLISLLAFGLPLVGHEDDARRAVEAAVFLLDPANNRGVPCAIGASTGLPFCGGLGSPGRRVVYTVTGTDVVRAARLMQLAKDGELLCDEDTQAAARRDTPHHFALLPRFALKGYDTPVRVFRVVPIRTATHPIGPGIGRTPNGPESQDWIVTQLKRLGAESFGKRLIAHLRNLAADNPENAERECERLLAEDRLVIDHGVCEMTERPIGPTFQEVRATAAPLVGRDTERATVAAGLDAVIGGASRVILLEGDTGAGKSRLLAEARKLAGERAMLVALGHCSEVESATPYYPWRAVFDDRLELSGVLDSTDRNERVLAALQSRPERLPLAPLLNDLLGLTLPEDEVVRQMAGQTRADNLRDVLVGLFAAATAGRPVLVILEDAHWADSASWRLAKQIREQVPHVAIAFAVRWNEAKPPAEYAEFAAADFTNHIILDALTEADARELAREWLGTASITKPLARLIWRRTQGRPLFIEHLVGHLRAAGLVEVRDGTAGLRSGSEADVEADLPDTIRGLIAARIDRLRPAHQLTAKVSSVVGPLFPARVLPAVYPEAAAISNLPDHVTTLTHERLLRQERPDPDAVYDFPNPVIWQVCYELLPRHQRQRLHLGAAEWYQAGGFGTGASQDRLIAHHWGKAGFADRQAEYLVRAGDAAMRDGAFREAVTGFTELLKLSREQKLPLATADNRAQWEFQLAEAYFGLGDLLAAAGHHRASLNLRGYVFRVSKAGLIVDTLAQMARQLIRRLRPFRRARTATADSATREVAAAYARLGRINYYFNDILAGTNAVLRALNEAEAGGPSPELATSYASAMILTGLLNWQRAARAYARLAEITAREVNQISNRSVVLAFLCMYHLGQGAWDTVEAFARASLRLAEKLGDHHQCGEAATIRAMLACFRADYPQAQRWAERVAEEAERSGNTLHTAWALNIVGECDLRLGRFEEAAVRLKESAQLLQGKRSQTEEIRVLGMQAALAARAGDWDSARDLATATAAAAATLTCSTLEGLAGAAEARIGWAEANPQDRTARKQANAAMACLRKYARLYPIGRPRLAVYEGRMHQLTGASARAVQAWREGLEHAQQLRMPYEAATLHALLGQHLPADSPDCRTHRQAAIEGYEQLGMAFEAAHLPVSDPR